MNIWEIQMGSKINLNYSGSQTMKNTMIKTLSSCGLGWLTPDPVGHRGRTQNPPRSSEHDGDSWWRLGYSSWWSFTASRITSLGRLPGLRSLPRPRAWRNISKIKKKAEFMPGRKKNAAKLKEDPTAAVRSANTPASRRIWIRSRQVC